MKYFKLETLVHMNKLILLCLFTFTSLSKFLHSDDQDISNHKIYVKPGTVFVSSNCIYINEEGNFIPVSSVSYNDCGVYVVIDSPDARQGDWRCTRCGTINTPADRKCTNCNLWR